MIAAGDRFTAEDPCPICQGYPDLPTGQGVRCWGFFSPDRTYANCTRDEYAGGLTKNLSSNTYGHILIGDCKCGTRHDPSLPASSNGNRRKKGPKEYRKEIEAYDYVDAQGTLIYQSVRYAYVDAKGQPQKTFKLRRPNGKGDYTWNMKGIAPLPYKLPELLEAIATGKTICIAEGEKDVKTLVDFGYVATCNHGGAGKWTDVHSAYLKGAVKVVLFGDNDQAGDKHIEVLIRSLATVGIVPHIAQMDGLGDKEDISDWMLTRTQEDLGRLVSTAKPAPAVSNVSLNGDGEQERRFPTLASISYTAQELQKKVIPDLVEVIPNILPEGLAMIAGGAGLGKSFLCLQVALDVCRGGKFLGQWPTIRGDVLYLATEDSERRIRDRMRQMWNDESVWPDNLTVSHRPQTLDTGLIDQLSEWLDEKPEVRLIIIDLFADVKPTRKPSSDWYADDRAAAKLLSALANTRHLCILASHHTNRLKSDDPFESFHGGNGLLGAAETKMILQPQQEGQATWLMKGRDVPQQAYLLRLDEGAWEYVGEAVTAGLSISRQAVLAYFQANAGYHSAETVAKALGKNTSTTWNLIEKLCQQRLVVKGDYGLYRLFQKDTL